MWGSQIRRLPEKSLNTEIAYIYYICICICMYIYIYLFKYFKTKKTHIILNLVGFCFPVFSVVRYSSSTVLGGQNEAGGLPFAGARSRWRTTRISSRSSCGNWPWLRNSVLGQGPGARKTSMGRCKLTRNGFDWTIYLTLSNDFQESFGGYSVEIRVTNEIHDDLQSYILGL